MRSNPMYFSGNPMFPIVDQCSYEKKDHAFSSVVYLVPPWLGVPMPFCSAHLNPSDIIFETTNNGNQIVFHPDLSSNFPSPGPVFSISQGNACKNDTTGERKTTSLLKEDSADIDALLSTEYEESLESEDDLVSTARSGVTSDCSSADSVSHHGSISIKKRLRTGDFSGSQGHQKKHQKLEKMKTLKGIVPDANDYCKCSE